MGHGRVVKSSGGTWALPPFLSAFQLLLNVNVRQARVFLYCIFAGPLDEDDGDGERSVWTRLRRCCDAFGVCWQPPARLFAAGGE